MRMAKWEFSKNILYLFDSLLAMEISCFYGLLINFHVCLDNGTKNCKNMLD